MVAVVHEEAHYAVMQTAWASRPKPALHLLCVRGKNIEQIEPEHEKCVRQYSHLAFVDSDKMDLGKGMECAVETLCKSGNALRLYQGRCLNLLYDTITVVV